VALEGAGATAGDGDDGGFDADLAITTGELRQLLPDLVQALGGLLQRDAAAPALPAAPAAAGTPADTTAPWDPVPA
jgi:recombination associated protein RdgC